MKLFRIKCRETLRYLSYNSGILEKIYQDFKTIMLLRHIHQYIWLTLTQNRNENGLPFVYVLSALKYTNVYVLRL